MGINVPARQHVLRVALAQLSSEIANVPANLAKARTYIEHAVAKEADIVAFPEMYLTNYTGQVESRELAEPLDGPSVRELADISRTSGVHIVMGMPTIDPDWPGFIYNSAVVISPSGVLGAHHKISLPTFDIAGIMFTEGNHWSPGTQFPLFRIEGWTVGVNICADCWVTEIPRIQAINGAHLLLTISAGPSVWREGWPIILRARAIENAVFQCYANVVGRHRGIDFFGGNLAVSPDGDVLAAGPQDEEALVIADLDFAVLHHSRSEYPRLRPGYDRQPALYGDLIRTVNPNHAAAAHWTEPVDQERVMPPLVSADEALQMATDRET